MKTRPYALAACVLGFLALGACNSNKTESDAAMAVKADNTVCPVGGGPVSESVTPVSYGGKNIGFCCAGCKGKFEKMTDADKSKTIAGMH